MTNHTSTKSPERSGSNSSSQLIGCQIFEMIENVIGHMKSGVILSFQEFFDNKIHINQCNKGQYFWK